MRSTKQGFTPLCVQSHSSGGKSAALQVDVTERVNLSPGAVMIFPQAYHLVPFTCTVLSTTHTEGSLVDDIPLSYEPSFSIGATTRVLSWMLHRMGTGHTLSRVEIASKCWPRRAETLP